MTMSLFLREPNKGAEIQTPPSGSSSTLENGYDSGTSWVKRSWLITDLNLRQDSMLEKDQFQATFELQRAGLPKSGIDQTPVTVTLLLSIKAAGKEISLLTGLLGRSVQTEEEIQGRSIYSERLQGQISELRAEVESLERENLNLKHTLMESQRPRRVS